MKANIPTRVSNKQMAAIRKEVAKELERQEQSNIRRVFKLVCASLHEQYGFGKVRCGRVLQMVSKLAAEHENDEVYWYHIDRLMEQIGIEFINENYEEVDR
jgi:hypothetical protein